MNINKYRTAYHLYLRDLRKFLVVKLVHQDSKKEKMVCQMVCQKIRKDFWLLVCKCIFSFYFSCFYFLLYFINELN